MALEDGSDDALEALLDDALRDLEEDAACQPPTPSDLGSSSDTTPVRQSAGATTRGDAGSGGLAFDPLKGPKPSAGTRRGAAADGERLVERRKAEDVREVCAGLTKLTEEIAALGSQENGPGSWPADAGHQDTLNALKAALADTTHPGQGVAQDSDDGNMEAIVGIVMQKLLSKEMLYEPMKDICSRYPAWFEANAATLDKLEEQRFRKQYECIKKIIDMYEKEPDNTSEIMNLMQEVQSCGQPPQDIVEQVAPGLEMGDTLDDAGPASVPPGDFPELAENCKMQ
ncbi:unnamed protein product [Ostreobium quekettii]|uniref:Peroxin-19 n=1 Tax=Ostreobium quekettii TaxID=121088 RepID=A0A8S1IPD1_9CHLO|nr:unnamed protein product [Ostreobium quekettii]